MSQKPKSLKKELTAVLGENDNCKEMLRAVVNKAIEGDMKAFEAIRDILGEEPPGKEAGPTMTIQLGPGVEELAQ